MGDGFSPYKGAIYTIIDKLCARLTVSSLKCAIHTVK